MMTNQRAIPIRATSEIQQIAVNYTSRMQINNLTGKAHFELQYEWKNRGAENNDNEQKYVDIAYIFGMYQQVHINSFHAKITDSKNNNQTGPAIFYHLVGFRYNNRYIFVHV